MTAEAKITLRLQFLARVVRKECRHLATTDQRYSIAPDYAILTARFEAAANESFIGLDVGRVTPADATQQTAGVTRPTTLRGFVAQQPYGAQR